MESDFDKDGWANEQLLLGHTNEKDYSDDWETKITPIYKSVKTKIRCNVWRPLDNKWWKTLPFHLLVFV